MLEGNMDILKPKNFGRDGAGGFRVQAKKIWTARGGRVARPPADGANSFFPSEKQIKWFLCIYIYI